MNVKIWQFIDWSASWVPDEKIFFSTTPLTPDKVVFHADKVIENRVFLNASRGDRLKLSEGWKFQAAKFTPTTHDQHSWHPDAALCPKCYKRTEIATLVSIDDDTHPWLCMCEGGHIWTVFLTDRVLRGEDSENGILHQELSGALCCRHWKKLPAGGHDCVVFPGYKLGVLTARFYDYDCSPCYDSPTFQHFVFRIVETPDVSKTDLWLKL